ncbi:MAG TPA: hypothetical protein VK783_11280, partial [Bacteroidia bacterium]|nr:hypothetical protein [Bacteroidia bacterium]
MRSLFTFVLWVLTVTLFVEGCTKKTYEETLPQVNFVSVVPYGNDSAIITGNVSSAGASPIEYVGFAYSTTPSFDILSNQILGNGTLGQFSAQIKASQDSTYYFKCFAANSYGYKVSQV